MLISNLYYFITFKSIVFNLLNLGFCTAQDNFPTTLTTETTTPILNLVITTPTPPSTPTTEISTTIFQISTLTIASSPSNSTLLISSTPTTLIDSKFTSPNTKSSILDITTTIPDSMSSTPDSKPPIPDSKPPIQDLKPPIQDSKLPGLPSYFSISESTQISESRPSNSDSKPPIPESNPLISDTKSPISDPKLLISDSTPIPVSHSPISTSNSSTSESTQILESKPSNSDSKSLISDTKPLISDTKPLISDPKLPISDPTPIPDSKPPISTSNSSITESTPISESRPSTSDSKLLIPDSNPSILNSSPPISESSLISDKKPPTTYPKLPILDPKLPTTDAKLLISVSNSSSSSSTPSMFNSTLNNSPPVSAMNTATIRSNSINAENDSLDFDLNPYLVKEEGCPIVIERHNLNLTRLEGDWKLPYASLNWLADMSIALLNRSAKKSEMLSHCPEISAKSFYPIATNSSSNITFSTTWKCPRSNHQFEISCWPHNKSISKFVCWNNMEMRLIYLMLVATDHKSWFVLVRCSPSEGIGKPTEGMSWAIISKTTKLKAEVSKVLLSLLEGYGFDIEAFKSTLTYDVC